MTKRLIGIDVMQGIAMVLVVLGHHLFNFMPEWYKDLFVWIYTFHMPLFIFISGFLIRYSYKGVNNWKEYKQYITKRIKKFFLPFLIVGTIGTLATWNFKDVSVLLNNLLNLIVSPKQSEVTFLWYIYLLFIFYCTAPIIFNAKSWIKALLFIGAIYLSTHVIPVGYLCIDWFSRYFVFFLSGALIARYYHQIRQHKSYCLSICVGSFVAFILMSIAIFNGNSNSILRYLIQWVGIPAFALIAYILKQWRTTCDALVYVSINCFGVYLLHMFIVQAGAMFITWLPINIPSWGYIVYLIMSTTLSISITALIWKLFNKRQKIKLSTINR